MHKQTKNLKKNLTTVLLSLGGMVFFSVVIYALGTLDGVNSTSGTSGLAVQGVPNKVEVLEAITFLEDGSNVSGTTLGYSGHTNSSQTGYLHIQGPINMESLVVGSGNRAGTRSAVFGGENNQASATNSAIAGGTDNQINGGSNSVIAGSQGGRIGSSNQVLLGAVAVEENNENQISRSTNSVLAAGDGSTLSNAQQTFVAGSGNMVQNTNSTVILGKNVNVNNKNQIFVYSNTGTFSPSSPNAFYINAQSGVAVNKTAATTALDIAGELAFTDIVSDLQRGGESWKGTITLVQKTLPNTREQKIGLCGHNGERWQPLTEVAYEHKLCIPGRLACDKVPVNAHRSNLEDDTCEWACDAGYAEVGNQCVKAQWVQESSQVCQLVRENGTEQIGKQAKKTVEWKCKAGTMLVDVKKCNHRRENNQAPSPLNEVTYVYDASCVDSTCELLANDCSGAGMCRGGVNQHQPASCQRKRMTAANTIETVTERGNAVCQRACENGACGRLHRGQIENLTASHGQLCAKGGVADFRPESFNNILTKWIWSCNAKDGNELCFTNKETPDSAKCSETEVNRCLKGQFLEINDTSEAHIWGCTSPVKGANSVECKICKPGYEADSQKNCVPVKPKCNKCRKDGFPYCFDVDMSPNCDGGKTDNSLDICPPGEELRDVEISDGFCSTRVGVIPISSLSFSDILGLGVYASHFDRGANVACPTMGNSRNVCPITHMCIRGICVEGIKPLEPLQPVGPIRFDPDGLSSFVCSQKDELSCRADPNCLWTPPVVKSKCMPITVRISE